MSQYLANQPAQWTPPTTQPTPTPAFQLHQTHQPGFGSAPSYTPSAYPPSPLQQQQPNDYRSITINKTRNTLPSQHHTNTLARRSQVRLRGISRCPDTCRDLLADSKVEWVLAWGLRRLRGWEGQYRICKRRRVSLAWAGLRLRGSNFVCIISLVCLLGKIRLGI